MWTAISNTRFVRHSNASVPSITPLSTSANATICPFQQPDSPCVSARSSHLSIRFPKLSHVIVYHRSGNAFVTNNFAHHLSDYFPFFFLVQPLVSALSEQISFLLLIIDLLRDSTYLRIYTRIHPKHLRTPPHQS